MVALALLIHPNGASAQSSTRAVVQSSDLTPCAGCTLRAVPVGVIGAVEREGAYLASRPSAVARTTRGDFIVMAGGPPQLFDSTGKYLRTIGRRGDGPGEFSHALHVGIGRGDTVFFNDRQTVSVFAPDFSFVRQLHPAHNLTGMIALPSGGFAWYATVRDEIGAPLVHVAGRDGNLLRSFGPRVDSVVRGRARLRSPAAIVHGAGGTFWTVPWTPYELTQWSPDGRALATLRRNVPFHGHGPLELSEPPAERPFPPQPQVTAAHQDQRGLMWTAVLVGVRDYWRGPKTAENLNQAFESIVEVIDPNSGELIATTKVPGAVGWIFPNGILVTDWFGPDFEPQLRIWRAVLTVPK
jgi:hypothetical protein